MKTNFRVTWASIFFLLIGLSIASTGHAQSKTFDLPAQALGDSLRAVASVTQTNVIFDWKLVDGRQAPALKAQMSVAEVLSRLLEGTGLTYRRADDRTVMIVSESAGAQITSESGAEKGTKLTLAQNVGTMSAGIEKSSEASEAKRENDNLQEIIVTAQKRSERLLDVPQSMSVLSGDDLKKLNATQFRDLANTVPGLNFTTNGAGQNRISLRGVTAGADVSQTVAIYVDDVPWGTSTTFLGSAIGLDMALFNLDRIEVLRGPQGTLYGASSLGGLIKYVTKQPDTQRFSGDAQAGFSGTNDGGTNYNVAMSVNVPIIDDKFATRVSGFYSKDGGYIDNVGRGEEDVNQSGIYGGRVDMLFTPLDELSIRIMGLVQDIDREGSGLSDYVLAGVPVTDSLSQRHLVPESFTQRFRLANATLTYDTGGASLVSSSSFQSVRSNLVADLSGAYVPLLRLPFYGSRNYAAVTNDNDLNWEKFCQELRLVSAQGPTVDWLIGGFYTHENSDSNSVIRPYDLLLQPGPTDVSNTLRPSRYEEYAAFGDLTWHASERLDVTGGIRYSRSDVKTQRIGVGILTSSQSPTDSRDDVATYLANARYRINDRMNTYVRHATGYRPGGPNFAVRDVNGNIVGRETFDADTLDSYEIGFKADAFDGRLGIDLAGYYVDWQDVQVQVVRGTFAGIFNAPGGATVRGAELTLRAQPLSGFTVGGAVAYADAQLSEADTDLRGAKGERLPNVPDWQGALNLDYQFPAYAWEPTIGATMRHVSDRTSGFSGAATSYYRLPDYTTVDLRAGFTIGPVTTQLYVHNLTDERGQLSTTVLSGIASVALMQPRTIGISVNTSF